MMFVWSLKRLRISVIFGRVGRCPGLQRPSRPGPLKAGWGRAALKSPVCTLISPCLCLCLGHPRWAVRSPSSFRLRPHAGAARKQTSLLLEVLNEHTAARNVAGLHAGPCQALPPLPLRDGGTQIRIRAAMGAGRGGVSTWLCLVARPRTLLLLRSQTTRRAPLFNTQGGSGVYFWLFLVVFFGRGCLRFISRLDDAIKQHPGHAGAALQSSTPRRALLARLRAGVPATMPLLTDAKLHENKP